MSGADRAAHETTAQLRIATPDDARGVLAIYAPLVRDTVITFEFEPPTAEAMAQRMSSTLARWPWLVCEREGSVLGYAYASSHRERAAYQWCVETAIYVSSQAQRSGVARALYHALFAMLRAQGACNAYAGITLPNAASVGLHEALGFRRIGIYEKVGFKLGAWHDVGWWQLALLPHPVEPAAPRPFAALQTDRVCSEALAAGRQLLRC